MSVDFDGSMENIVCRSSENTGAMVEEYRICGNSNERKVSLGKDDMRSADGQGWCS